jgi:hypothetical protein
MKSNRYTCISFVAVVLAVMAAGCLAEGADEVTAAEGPAEAIEDDGDWGVGEERTVRPQTGFSARCAVQCTGLRKVSRAAIHCVRDSADQRAQCSAFAASVSAGVPDCRPTFGSHLLQPRTRCELRRAPPRPR